MHFDDVVTFNGALCNFPPNVPDEKGVSDNKIQIKPLDILCLGTRLLQTIILKKNCTESG